MIGGRRLLVMVAGAMLAGACGGSDTTSTEVDGWSPGAFIRDCLDAANRPACTPMTTPALAAFAAERPVVALKIYEEGAYVDDAGQAHLITRGGGPVMIVIATLDDGTRRAVGVYCGLDPVDSMSKAPCAVVDPPFS